MASILFLSIVLLLSADFTFGDDCNPCDVFIDPTSPLSNCGVVTDSSVWAQMYRDCELKRSNGNQLDAHFTNVLAFCAAKGVDLNIDFVVCPPVSRNIGCSVCNELTGRAEGIKACADSLPALIWGNIIMDCIGYEERGDISGRNDLMVTLQVLCAVKHTSISFVCPFSLILAGTDIFQPCFQQLSTREQSSIVKDCLDVVGTDGYLDLLNNLTPMCAEKGEGPLKARSCGK
ncbi:hypothetical protein LSH36_371g03058 [Paralvinella palmiformis]|uniref:Uncharacterized protein n=1 Tax=Paralvinella palmiformis TaxID=53620 RepID=A0AAD9JF87_9ANNE|nr:hypothetical protein LSH36_371g03058 [Paralvinella palmiformis]